MSPQAAARAAGPVCLRLQIMRTSPARIPLAQGPWPAIQWCAVRGLGETAELWGGCSGHRCDCLGARILRHCHITGAALWVGSGKCHQLALCVHPCHAAALRDLRGAHTRICRGPGEHQGRAGGGLPEPDPKAPVDVAILDVLAPALIGRDGLDIPGPQRRSGRTLRALECDGVFGRGVSLLEMCLDNLKRRRPLRTWRL